MVGGAPVTPEWAERIGADGYASNAPEAVELALGVKRLHDRDMSGWWTLISFVPFGGFILLVILGFLDGTQGPNRFGPSPKGIGGASDRELGSVFS